MKKITLLAAMMVFGINSYAQNTISFETSEGYTLGDINAQTNWETTADGSGGFIANQTVSDELATDGTNALKLVTEVAYGPQTNAIVGAFYNYPTAISNADTSFSADIYLSEQGGTSKSLLFGLVHNDNPDGPAYRTYINFAFGGTIDALVLGDTPGMIVRADTGATWQPLTWYNVEIKTEGSVVRFLIDGVEVFDDNLVSNGPVNQVRFAHDNYDGTIYIDNFQTVNNALSVKDFTVTNVSHFYDEKTNELVLNSKDAAFTNVEVYNTLGQNVLTNKLALNTERIDFSALSSGIYLVKATTKNGVVKTIKTLKP